MGFVDRGGFPLLLHSFVRSTDLYSRPEHQYRPCRDSSHCRNFRASSRVYSSFNIAHPTKSKAAMVAARYRWPVDRRYGFMLIGVGLVLLAASFRLRDPRMSMIASRVSEMLVGGAFLLWCPKWGRQSTSRLGSFDVTSRVGFGHFRGSMPDEFANMLYRAPSLLLGTVLLYDGVSKLVRGLL